MSRWTKLRGRFLGPRAARSLVEECGAFLQGTYAEQAARESAAVPAWALLNTVAHGDLKRIRAQAKNGGGSLRWALPLGWSKASREIAREVSDLVGDDEQVLESFQVSVLVPLELRLMKAPGAQDDVAAVAAWARAALRSASW